MAQKLKNVKPLQEADHSVLNIQVLYGFIFLELSGSFLYVKVADFRGRSGPPRSLYLPRRASPPLRKKTYFSGLKPEKRKRHMPTTRISLDVIFAPSS